MAILGETRYPASGLVRYLFGTASGGPEQIPYFSRTTLEQTPYNLAILSKPSQIFAKFGNGFFSLYF